MNYIAHDTAEHALRQPELAGIARMVYLDPPYNTGKQFGQYLDRAPVDDWMRMMYRTIDAAHKTLREDGSIWVHLDDKYIHRVRTMLDDVFGETNYVGTIIWEKKNRASFLHAQLADVTDHVLVYARNRSQMAPLIGSSTESGKRIPVHHRGNTPTVLSFPAGSMSFNFSDRVVPAGAINTSTIDSALLDDLNVVDGINENAFRISGPFRYSQEAINHMAASTTTAFICPRTILRPSYLSQDSHGKVLTNLQSFRINGAPTNEDARAESEELFGGSFDTPKPERLLERFITAATDLGDVVIDPFAGSGTTLAVAEKTGRRWVGVEQSRTTIDDFIVPRIRRATSGTDTVGMGPGTPSGLAYRIIGSDVMAAA